MKENPVTGLTVDDCGLTCRDYLLNVKGLIAVNIYRWLRLLMEEPIAVTKLS